jgi:modulator of drug activity B
LNNNLKTNNTVVITGIGLITCLGSDKETFWNSILQGKSGVRRITQFDPSDLPCQIAGEIPDFDPSQFIPAKEARRMSRCSQIGLTAAITAMDDAALPQESPQPERVGVYFGTAIGGWDRGMEGVDALREKGLSRVNPFALPSTLANMPAFHVAKHFGAHGPNITITTACATGTQTVGEAAQAIRNGWADVIITQSPIYWFGTPWIHKKYIDEIFTTGLVQQSMIVDDGRTRQDPERQYGTGGKMDGKKYMLSLTWNAPAEAFCNEDQVMFEGKGVDDVFVATTGAYKFCGAQVLPSFSCYDVVKDPHIENDMERLKQHLSDVFSF